MIYPRSALPPNYGGRRGTKENLKTIRVLCFLCGENPKTKARTSFVSDYTLYLTSFGYLRRVLRRYFASADRKPPPVRGRCRRGCPGKTPRGCPGIATGRGPGGTPGWYDFGVSIFKVPKKAARIHEPAPPVRIYCRMFIIAHMF